MSHPDDPATKADVRHVSDRVDNLGGDVKILKMQVRTMDSKLEDLGSDVRSLDAKMEDLGSDVRRLEVLFEAMGDDIKSILETVAPRVQQVTEREDKIKDHEERITTLETFKKAAA